MRNLMNLITKSSDIMTSKHEVCKKCSHCHKLKPLSSFSDDKYNKDGLTAQCKGCRKWYDRLRYLRLTGKWGITNT